MWQVGRGIQVAWEGGMRATVGKAASSGWLFLLFTPKAPPSIAWPFLRFIQY